MTSLLKALYYACSTEDPSTFPSLADHYHRSARAQAALHSIGEDPSDAMTEYGEAMEEQGFVNGFRYAVLLFWKQRHQR